MNDLFPISLGIPAAAAVAVLIVLLLKILLKAAGVSFDRDSFFAYRDASLPPWLSVLLGVGIAVFAVKLCAVVLKAIGGRAAW